MPIRVCVAGATGWVGRPLVAALSRSSDLVLVGAVSRSAAGQPAESALGLAGSTVTLRASVEEALAAPTDVLVDYTSAGAVRDNVLAAVARGVHVVVGSSGLTDDDYAVVDRAARERGVGVLAVGNFAMAAVLLQRFAVEAARRFRQWEIVDYASASKVDAPSGTARQMATALRAVRAPEPTVPVAETTGAREARGATLAGSQVHSIRLPGFVIGLEVVFGDEDERLLLRYDAGSGPEPYIPGTLLAIRKVQGLVGLVRGLDGLLD